MRVGFVVGKKIGGAVLRNRTKRVLKETLRVIDLDICGSFDILLVVRKDCGVLKIPDLREELKDKFPYLLS